MIFKEIYKVKSAVNSYR